MPTLVEVPKMKLLFALAIIAALTACGGSSAPTPAPTTLGIPFTQSGQLVFPGAAGFQATASYTLSSTPDGAAAILTSQAGGAGLPVPFQATGPVIAAFTLRVTGDVQTTELPNWKITAPSTTTLSGAYALEYCSTSECDQATYAAVTGQTLTIIGAGGTQAFAPNANYVFELVPFTPPVPYQFSAASEQKGELGLTLGRDGNTTSIRRR